MMIIQHLLFRYILVSFVYCVYISNLGNLSTTGAVGPTYKLIICVYTHTPCWQGTLSQSPGNCLYWQGGNFKLGSLRNTFKLLISSNMLFSAVKDPNKIICG